MGAKRKGILNDNLYLGKYKREKFVKKYYNLKLRT